MSEQEHGEPDGGRKLKVIAISVILVVVAIVVMALLAEQAEPLPFEYEGF